MRPQELGNTNRNKKSGKSSLPENPHGFATPDLDAAWWVAALSGGHSARSRVVATKAGAARHRASGHRLCGFRETNSPSLAVTSGGILIVHNLQLRKDGNELRSSSYHRSMTRPCTSCPIPIMYPLRGTRSLSLPQLASDYPFPCRLEQPKEWGSVPELAEACKETLPLQETEWELTLQVDWTREI